MNLATRLRAACVDETASESVTHFDETRPRWRGALVVEPGMCLAQRYVVGKRVGRGGSGVVFRAWDTRLSAAVALKVLSADPGSERWVVRQAAREVVLGREVRHPNVCAVFDLEEVDGTCFLTMELARGGTLRDELRRRGGDEPGGAAWLRDVLQVCDGMAALHARGIVHGDLTLRNILRMSPERLAIADLGMARSEGDDSVIVGGTPGCMAPEVLAGARPRACSDVWQLGLILCELLDAAPARGATGEAVRAIGGLAESCLAHDPAARPRDARRVAAALPRG
jgi:serine/threonine protein kinase